GGGPFVEDEGAARGRLGEGLLEDAALLPEAQGLALFAREIELGRDLREERFGRHSLVHLARSGSVLRAYLEHVRRDVEHEALLDGAGDLEERQHAVAV